MSTTRVLSDVRHDWWNHMRKRFHAPLKSVLESVQTFTEKGKPLGNGGAQSHGSKEQFYDCQAAIVRE